MYGYIYLTTNNINQKQYIGQHKAEVFSCGYKGSGKALRDAFKKYGKDNFTTVLLEECFSQEELDAREIYYINKYDAVNNPNFYNLIPGGHGAGESARINMSNARNGIKNATKGTVWIHNDVEHLRVSKEKLEEYLALGYKIGGCKRSDISKKRYSKAKQNLVTMTDENVTIYVTKDEVNDYIEKGYRVGRIKQTECSPAKDRIWIHKDGQSKMIFDSELPTYLERGYSVGRAKFKGYKKRKSSPTKGKKKTILEDGTIRYV